MSKNIVITGGTRGLGFAMAGEFLNAGCAVALCGTTAERVASALQRLDPPRGSAGQVYGDVCDVRNREAVEIFWNRVRGEFGAIDIWINNAGISQQVLPLWEIETADIEALVHTNILGVIYGSQVAMQGMLRQGHGAIYSMEGLGSGGEHRGKLTLYGTSKCAVRYFTRGLSIEAEGTPILIGTLSPGMMVTDFLLSALPDRSQQSSATRRMINTLADRPETVAKFLVPKILTNQRRNAHFAWLTAPKVLWRFLSLPFVRRDLLP